MSKEKNEVVKIWREYPAFRDIQFSTILTSFFTWSSFIAMLVLLASITETGIQFGTLWAVSGLAPILFSLYLGVWVDRLDVRKSIIAAEIIKSVLFLGFIIIPFIDNMFVAWSIFMVIRLGTGTLNSFTSAAKQVAIPSIVKKDDLIVANSLNYTITSTVRLSGAAAGGLIVTFVGIHAAYFLTALSFIVSAWLIFRNTWKTEEHAENKERNFKREFAEGLTFAMKNVNVLLILVAALTIGTIIGSYNLMLERFNSQVYNFATYGISLLYLAEGLVSVILGYWIAKNKFLLTKTHIYGIFYSLIGVSWMAFGFTTNIIYGILVLIFFGMFCSVVVPYERTKIQMEVPPHLRGKIFSLWGTLTLAAIQLGALITGFIIDLIGLTYVPIITGFMQVIFGLTFLTVLLRKKNIDTNKKVSSVGMR
ncbi:major facilitator superfamily macrolide-efflux protein (plasmid) [Alkalihalophilus pseudofirmus OF4]|uniref:Major facilitator superfamily macrolide-efflux protein n=1 Tax=Alkalihalophilus pseudofirmus (strain ATCC BAA-2126 / JCM 17055 / OF4) TaxID=398511 RepID=D3G1P6_ALKPO|nr:MFS transporter [Alkalihalophilus pseudofirmus]ADC52272.1 major facilitator superfamily macrolide-efflux protein [Alkalihalophilus pseudofirmus OF4]